MSARKGDWDQQESQVIGALERLRKGDTSRNPALELDARQRFLEEAARLRPQTAAVSPTRNARHTMPMRPSFFKWAGMRMSTLVTILVIVLLALGGTGVTVYAAQSSLPGDVLYGIKLANEAIETSLTLREQSRVQLAMRLSDARIDEMAGLAKKSRSISEDLEERWRFQVERAFEISAAMNDADLEEALVQVREHLRVQDGRMADLNNQPQVRERVRSMIQERLRGVEEGLMNPAAFRRKLQNEQPGMDGQNPWTTGTPLPDNEYSPGTGECVGCTPENVQNPWMTGTPTPGSGYGPGPGVCLECTPESSKNPWTTGTPTPGSGYGPGPASGKTPIGPGGGDGGGGAGGTGGGGSGGGSGTGGGSGGDTGNGGGNQSGESGGGGHR